jgi:hypothetical protein
MCCPFMLMYTYNAGLSERVGLPCPPPTSHRLQILVMGTSNKDTWHDTQVFDLTYFSRSQKLKFEKPLIIN